MLAVYRRSAFTGAAVAGEHRPQRLLLPGGSVRKRLIDDCQCLGYPGEDLMPIVSDHYEILDPRS